jgi:hypothetical protein
VRGGRIIRYSSPQLQKLGWDESPPIPPHPPRIDTRARGIFKLRSKNYSIIFTPRREFNLLSSGVKLTPDGVNCGMHAEVESFVSILGVDFTRQFLLSRVE